MRPLIREVLDLVERHRERSPPSIVIEAPPGYGKSVGAPLVYERLYEHGYAESMVHVLPLRAIVHDLYCTFLNAVSEHGCIDHRRSSPPEVRDALQRAGIDATNLAYQMGELLLCKSCRKEPLFDARYVVTTLDSFLLNLFRVPVTEVYDLHKHYAIPRLRLFLSTVYLDEAHMLFEEGEEASRLYTASTSAIEILAKEFRTPIVIASATLGEKALRELLETLKEQGKNPHVTKPYVIKLAGKSEALTRRFNGEAEIIAVHDEEFEEKALGISWKTELIADNDVVRKIREHVENGQRVLVVRDSVNKAVETFRLIRQSLPLDDKSSVLIHGLMTHGDRRRALARLEHSKVVVATSVIEAGVNISLDVLVTDGLRPRSVVQRTGRICRYAECVNKEAVVYIVRDRSDEMLLEFVGKTENRVYSVNWRLPYDKSGVRGYGSLLDVIEPPESDENLSRYLKAISYPLFVQSRDIDEVLEEVCYSLVREGLYEIAVCDENIVDCERGELKSLDFESVAENRLTVNERVVTRLASKGCLGGLAVFLGDGSIKKVCETKEFIKLNSSSNQPRVNCRGYVECLRKAMRESMSIDVALLVKSECYVRGEGLTI